MLCWCCVVESAQVFLVAVLVTATCLTALLQRFRALLVRCWYVTAGGTGGADDWWYWRVNWHSRKWIGGNWRSWNNTRKWVEPAVVDAVGGGATTEAGATLGSVGKPGETVDVVAGDGVGCIVVTVAKMLASRWSAVTWLLLD
jgi:hypothetical protein